MVPVETLRKLDLFEGLNEIELNAVTSVADLIDCRKGAAIFSENEEATKLYVLLDGMVSINFEVGRHQEVIVHTVKAGEAFGWSALVQPYRFTASAKCMQDSKVITVDGDNLKKLLKDDCHMGYVIMEKLAALVSGRLQDTRVQLISAANG